jgi:hypothetical protein
MAAGRNQIDAVFIFAGSNFVNVHQSFQGQVGHAPKYYQADSMSLGTLWKNFSHRNRSSGFLPRLG